jgi:5-(carboxyamino)imidazole ribonucleotide mutase
VDSPVVGVIMGSKSDLETMRPAAEALQEFGVPFELRVVSAHRTPESMFEYAKSARLRGLKVIIAGAGGAAHLPGMVASLTTLPVIGVPVQTKAPLGNGRNAGLLAVRILAASDEQLAARLDDFAQTMKDAVAQMDEEVSSV